MAGACLGPLSNMKDTTLGTGGYFYTLIALGNYAIPQYKSIMAN